MPDNKHDQGRNGPLAKKNEDPSNSRYGLPSLQSKLFRRRLHKPWKRKSGCCRKNSVGLADTDALFERLY